MIMLCGVYIWQADIVGFENIATYEITPQIKRIIAAATKVDRRFVKLSGTRFTISEIVMISAKRSPKKPAKEYA